MSDPVIVPDSQARGLLALLPRSIGPYVQLMRLDRPIGAWLLFWPCAWSVALAGGIERNPWLILWFGIGAIVMRSAGCIYNDIVDRELDARVARTASRPLASGRITLAAAWSLLAILCVIGFVVLLQVNRIAAIVALLSLAPVAAYPFMKRITWWPQAWLGMVFSWGALVGWAAVSGWISPIAVLLYAGSIAWVVGYDTIYALQDREDDALVGVHSSARLLGDYARGGVALFYLVAVLLWAIAFWAVRPEPLALLALLPAAVQLLGQVIRLDPSSSDNALAVFRSNRTTGLLVFLACAVVGMTS
jgi:4-hydroxybenzoate polyprenyltransferase